jgi:hypothetical protein
VPLPNFPQGITVLPCSSTSPMNDACLVSLKMIVEERLYGPDVVVVICRGG